MKGAVLYRPGDVRYEERADPTIAEEVGCDVKHVRKGQFVVGSFVASLTV